MLPPGGFGMVPAYGRSGYEPKCRDLGPDVNTPMEASGSLTVDPTTYRREAMTRTGDRRQGTNGRGPTQRCSEPASPVAGGVQRHG